MSCNYPHYLVFSAAQQTRLAVQALVSGNTSFCPIEFTADCTRRCLLLFVLIGRLISVAASGMLFNQAFFFLFSTQAAVENTADVDASRCCCCVAEESEMPESIPASCCHPRHSEGRMIQLTDSLCGETHTWKHTQYSQVTKTGGYFHVTVSK